MIEAIWCWFLLKTMGKITLMAFGLWLYKELTMGLNKSERSLKGKVALVTGGTDGLGLETAMQLAKRGCRVIITYRNKVKAEASIDMIVKRLGHAEIQGLALDLASFKSILAFDQALRQVTDKIDILVNNAGTFSIEHDQEGLPMKKYTEDGLELVMGVNYFGHVVLTEKILDLLKAAGRPEDPARIVTLSSIGHVNGRLNINDFDLNSNSRPYNASYQYNASKMALIHWSNHLGRQFQAFQDPVVSVSVNPGLVRTNIFNQTPFQVKFLMSSLFYLLGKNVEQGCQSILHCILSSFSTLNGLYISDCRQEQVLLSSQLYNPKVEEMLWNYTHDLIESVL